MLDDDAWVLVDAEGVASGLVSAYDEKTDDLVLSINSTPFSPTHGDMESSFVSTDQDLLRRTLVAEHVAYNVLKDLEKTKRQSAKLKEKNRLHKQKIQKLHAQLFSLQKTTSPNKKALIARSAPKARGASLVRLKKHTKRSGINQTKRGQTRNGATKKRAPKLVKKNRTMTRQRSSQVYSKRR